MTCSTCVLIPCLYGLQDRDEMTNELNKVPKYTIFLIMGTPKMVPYLTCKACALPNLLGAGTGSTTTTTTTVERKLSRRPLGKKDGKG